MFIGEKVVPSARVTLPAEVRQLASPRRVGDPHVNGSLNLSKKEVKSQLAQGNSGELGLPRVARDCSRLSDRSRPQGHWQITPSTAAITIYVIYDWFKCFHNTFSQLNTPARRVTLLYRLLRWP